MKNDQSNESRELSNNEGRSSSASRDARRRLIKTGATIVPVVLTLRATPAWAQVDYTQTAYRYGTNAGLCRNPHFNPNANPDSPAGTEFIPCPDKPRARPYDPLQGTTSGTGSTVNERPRDGF